MNKYDCMAPADFWNWGEWGLEVYKWKGSFLGWFVGIMVSFEISFDSKQPKLVPKLVSALSETKHLFWLFRFYTETESFGVSIEPKQTEEQPKECDRENILVFFHKI